MKPLLQKVLLGYASLSSTALLGLVLLGAKHQKTAAFDEIQVQRINVVEPDGTTRMVLSSKSRLPPVVIQGKEHPEMGESRPQAGLIFYNDEGTENGGLIFGGRKNEKGEIIDSGGSLSFDKYGAGQIMQLAGIDDKDDRFAGLGINDGKRRVWIGREGEGVASVALSGADGKKRIVMKVAPDGTPSLAFYDVNGHIIQELAPKN